MRNIITTLTEKAGDKLANRSQNMVYEAKKATKPAEFKEKISQLSSALGFEDPTIISNYIDSYDLLEYISFANKELFEQVCEILPTVTQLQKDIQQQVKYEERQRSASARAEKKKVVGWHTEYDRCGNPYRTYSC